MTKERTKTLDHPVSSRRADWIDQYVGRRIRAGRKIKEMKQTDPAHRLKITHQQVQKYERGTSRTTAGRLWYLCSILGVPIDSCFPRLRFRGIPLNPELKSQARTGASGKGQLLAKGRSARQIEVDILVQRYSQIKDPKTRRKLIELIRLIFDGHEEIEPNHEVLQWFDRHTPRFYAANEEVAKSIGKSFDREATRHSAWLRVPILAT